MNKKLLISICALFSALTIQAMANTTIYTDEIGRLHFLGKDPGGRTMQEIQNFDNPEQKDLTNIVVPYLDSMIFGINNLNKTMEKTASSGDDDLGGLF